MKALVNQLQFPKKKKKNQKMTAKTGIKIIADLFISLAESHHI